MPDRRGGGHFTCQLAVGAVAQALRTIPAPNMTKLFLGGRYDVDMSPILSALYHGSFPQLKVLLLSDCVWSQAALRDLARALHTKLVVLEELHLCSCATNGMAALAEAFEHGGGARLKILRVCCSNGIEPLGARVAAVINAGGLPCLEYIRSGWGMDAADSALWDREKREQ